MTIFINENGIKRQLTEKEETQFNKQIEIDKVNSSKRNDLLEETENKKASGKQKLKDLGLDDDEIQALIGV